MSFFLFVRPTLEFGAFTIFLQISNIGEALGIPRVETKPLRLLPFLSQGDQDDEEESSPLCQANSDTEDSNDFSPSTPLKKVEESIYLENFSIPPFNKPSIKVVVERTPMKKGMTAADVVADGEDSDEVGSDFEDANYAE